jgi:endoglucanase
MVKHRRHVIRTAVAAAFLGLAVMSTSLTSGAAAAEQVTGHGNGNGNGHGHGHGKGHHKDCKGKGKGKGKGTCTPQPALTAMETVAAMEPGWNVGNTLDAIPHETAWGNPPITRELFTAVRAQGYNSVRIPVTWTDHHGEAPDYAIDPAYLNRVEEVVDWALEEDLYVLLNLHHDSWMWIHEMPTQHEAVLDRYTALWTQIADRFRDAPPELLLESVNEPQFANSIDEEQEFELLHELNVVFHEIVRDSGGVNASRVLVLPTLHTNTRQERIDPLLETFAELNDPYLAATVHDYGFWPFSVNIAGFTRFDEQTEQWLIDIFDRVHDSFVAAGIPVIIGEYGLLGFDSGNTGVVQQGEKLKFFEKFGSYAREKQLTTMLWDNGQHFNRATLQWRDESLYRQMASAWTVDSATGSSDQIFVRTGEEASDASITLNLAGNSLTAIQHGSATLVPGEDYRLSGDELTFAAATLARLTESQQHGVNATVSLEFSAGAPWDVNIIAFDTPTQQDATGTTAGLTIPTSFNGVPLATMEAVHPDGTNAGPADWTSFKEFTRDFDPNNDAGTITITERFFHQMDDGSTVHLTFHFWSGETLDYTLTRSGTTVTGTVG